MSRFVIKRSELEVKYSELWNNTCPGFYIITPLSPVHINLYHGEVGGFSNEINSSRTNAYKGVPDTLPTSYRDLETLNGLLGIILLI